MLKKNWFYYAKWVKFPQDKYTTLSVGVKNGSTGGYKNYNVFIFTKVDIKDGDKFKFIDFISIDQKEWKNKTQFQVTAEIEVEQVGATIPPSEEAYSQEDAPMIDDEVAYVEDEPVLNITSDDLPF